MYSIYLIFIIFMIIWIINALVSGKNIFKHPMFYSTFIVVNTISSAILVLVSLTYYQSDGVLVRKDIMIYSKNLRSLNDNIVTKGSFTLGTGQVDGISKYYYYYNVTNNTYKLEHVNTDDTVIIESDTTSPMIVKYKTIVDNDKMQWSNWLFNMTLDIESVHYEIYVPKNTIISNYMLDVK